MCTYKIAGVLDDFSPYIQNNSRVNVLLSDKMIEKENEEFDQMYMGHLKGFDILIDTNDVNEIENKIIELNNIRKIQGKQELYGTNILDGTNSAEQKEISRRMIIKIPIYIFVCMIAVFSILNIFNTISNSIVLRKREIAELKSIGMSDSQIRKMLILEGLFYGADGLIFGIIISIMVLFIMYIIMVKTKIYRFIIPYSNIIEIIAVTYIVIFLAMKNAKNKIKGKNIIEEIKEENI